jgi:hypothetical protein
MIREAADSIYDILVHYAGASPNERDRAMFIYHQEKGCLEYRFGGLLGFGGKFWTDGGRWRVTCYREDETKEARKILAKTNEVLARLRQAWLDREHGNQRREGVLGDEGEGTP